MGCWGQGPLQPPPVHVVMQPATFGSQAKEQAPPLQLKLQSAPSLHSMTQPPPLQLKLQEAWPSQTMLQLEPLQVALQLD